MKLTTPFSTEVENERSCTSASALYLHGLNRNGFTSLKNCDSEGWDQGGIVNGTFLQCCASTCLEALKNATKDRDFNLGPPDYETRFLTQRSPGVTFIL